MHVVVWAQGRQAATKGQDVEAALADYTQHFQINKDLQEIFRDGYANVNRDYAEELDAAEDLENFHLKIESR